MDLAFMEALVLFLLGYALGIRRNNGQGPGSKREPG